MKPFYTIIALVTFLPLITFSLPSYSFCQEAEINDVIITNTPDDLIIYFSVDGCFTKKMEEAIMSGISTTFTFFVKLYRPRSFWFDEVLTSLIIKHTIIYDNLRDEFKVTFNSQEKKEVIIKDFFHAKKVMSDVDAFPVIPMSLLKKNTKYYLKIKAELDPIRLPFFLNYVLFFVSLWDFETDWYLESFIY